MSKAKSILMLWAVLFAGLGGCFGPLMAGQHTMGCCASMPCAPASQSRNCCTAELPGAASHLQQTAEVTAPAATYAVLATLPHLSLMGAELTVTWRFIGLYCYSPPADLYTVYRSFLI